MSSIEIGKAGSKSQTLELIGNSKKLKYYMSADKSDFKMISWEKFAVIKDNVEHSIQLARLITTSLTDAMKKIPIYSEEESKNTEENITFEGKNFSFNFNGDSLSPKLGSQYIFMLGIEVLIAANSGKIKVDNSVFNITKGDIKFNIIIQENDSFKLSKFSKYKFGATIDSKKSIKQKSDDNNVALELGDLYMVAPKVVEVPLSDNNVVLTKVETSYDNGTFVWIFSAPDSVLNDNSVEKLPYKFIYDPFLAENLPIEIKSSSSGNNSVAIALGITIPLIVIIGIVGVIFYVKKRNSE